MFLKILFSVADAQGFVTRRILTREEHQLATLQIPAGHKLLSIRVVPYPKGATHAVAPLKPLLIKRLKSKL